MNAPSSTTTTTHETPLLNDQQAIERIFSHIDNNTTDLGDTIWREPVESYHSQERFAAEIALLRRLPVPYCPSAALPEAGSFIARTAAGTPLLVARGGDGVVRAFINACRHRGMQVADGTGCSKAFTCPYHAWTYDLEGALKGIPGRSGFADLDPEQHGLVEVNAAERGGIVYVAQDGPIEPAFLDGCLDYLTPEQELFEHDDELVDEANWKLINETAQEGYHIKSLHRDTFFPYGLDNTTLVETFGANSRIIFPFRRIEKLRDVEPDQRRLAGVATSVYHLFPNVHVSVLSKHTNLVVLEPLSPNRTRWINYRLINRHTPESPISLEDAQRDARFVYDFGLEEDRAAACAIQETMTTRANTHVTFGYFEKAIVNFHQHLALHLGPPTLS
jgi:phenylpropionate dioxygenase-like ring-hydroxylating dioxygenase large terminal subunit